MFIHSLEQGNQQSPQERFYFTESAFIFPAQRLSIPA
jgi:hypothetical protein